MSTVSGRSVCGRPSVAGGDHDVMVVRSGQPHPFEAAGTVQRLAGVVRQRDHRKHLVHTVRAQPGQQRVVDGARIQRLALRGA